MCVCTRVIVKIHFFKISLEICETKKMACKFSVWLKHMKWHRIPIYQKSTTWPKCCYFWCIFHILCCFKSVQSYLLLLIKGWKKLSKMRIMIFTEKKNMELSPFREKHSASRNSKAVRIYYQPDVHQPTEWGKKSFTFP